MIYFEQILPGDRLSIASDIAIWHRDHGWCYRVWQYHASGRRILGQFYVTLLSGFCGVMHFESYIRNIPAPVQLAAYRKAIRMMRVFDVLLVTIPRDRAKLIAVMRRLGFADCNIIAADFSVLQYHKLDKTIVDQPERK